MHWNGAAWSQVPSGTIDVLTDVWGTGPNDVWAVGGRNPGLSRTIVHWDGTAWSVSLTETGQLPLSSVWGSSPSDVWVGGSGLLLHWDGTGWSEVTVATPAPTINAIWGSGRNDVWAMSGTYDMAAAQTFGQTYHYDGTSWTAARVDVPGGFVGVSGTGADDVWAVPVSVAPS